jgi:putative transposase
LPTHFHTVTVQRDPYLRPLDLLARVGRKSAAPSASPQTRAYSHRAGLSSQPGSGRNVLLHGEPARPPVGLAGHTNRCGSAQVRARAPFHIDAWVVLPDHMHCLWILPEEDADFPGRWRAIKKGFSKSLRIGEPRSPIMIRRGERGILQRRYWEHTIRDDRDLAAHLDYIHFNPVKHGLVDHPAEWPHFSFRRCVAGGLYPAGWMRRAGEPPKTGERR